ncbi:hypothetical protein OCK74_03440 [Chitinophagaceae bacterium LB-8]|uniref:GIY-YIG domain-containing protein n=1 Tax=Paraflavisolibacter caeni TaxID=2982496 RepID=A0A9X2XUS6_9BACT|nr:hypothetical protein [Paraflavisolibacter caeni]MCU7548148.1 hypothetical protein [Paraflavisolibacter caeni]
MKKYLPVIKKINAHVTDFNSYLRKEFTFPLLNEDKLNDQTYYLNPTGKEWNDCQFPRNPHIGGVYFYMGETVSRRDDFHVYIGKASMKSKIGERLYNHFKNCWKTNETIIRNNRGEPVLIELITSIPFENEALIFLAPALEEYLIDKLRSDFPLFNIIGNN